MCGEDGSFLGVISVIDVNRGLAEYGTACAELPVRELMKADAVTCSLESTTDDLSALMRSNEIRHVPVVDAGKLTGLINIRDVLHHAVDHGAADVEFLTQFVFGAGYR